MLRAIEMYEQASGVGYHQALICTAMIAANSVNQRRGVALIAANRAAMVARRRAAGEWAICCFGPGSWGGVYRRLTAR